ncbi:hypothetical protein [Cupriavidus sp. AU9028]|uniref:MuF-C-terminal domain-containing protein n=1 Tax=Cupriavidus sp. AU9028 TaxID=2871157 RepID=UPI001C96ACC0|nr:hypothetical protein [Cupriavidus sp. AU9028]MBY4897505.1 hypothetical protein [Cupriavidus sp. AU9028]
MKNRNFDILIQTAYETLLSDKAHTIMGRAIEIGTTPQRYVDLGLPDLPLVVKVASLDKAFFRHGISLKFIRGIYGTLMEPKAIFKSNTHQTDINSVVLTWEVTHLGPVVVILHGGKVIGRSCFNEVASVYAKEAQGFEALWREKGLLLWEAGS